MQWGVSPVCIPQTNVGDGGDFQWEAEWNCYFSGAQSIKKHRKSVKGIVNRLKAYLIGCGVWILSWFLQDEKKFVGWEGTALTISRLITGKSTSQKTIWKWMLYICRTRRTKLQPFWEGPGVKCVCMAHVKSFSRPINTHIYFLLHPEADKQTPRAGTDVPAVS